MALNNITQKVIDLTEERTGRPVLVTPDASLSLLATVKPARGSAAVHVVAYNPSAQADADYLVCYQCGFILRLFEVPEQDRYDLAGAPQGISEVEKLIGTHMKETHLDLDKDTRVGFQDQLFNGLMLQLRSVSVGLRVDDWLRRDYPELGSQQRAMAARQLNENAAALQPRVRKMTPAKIYQASVAMSAAFAAYWSRAWNDPLPVVPFKTTGHLAQGEQLLKLWDEVPAEPACDSRLIQAWGKDLGLEGWFQFVPLA